MKTIESFSGLFFMALFSGIIGDAVAGAVPLPVAQFTMSPRSGAAPLTVSFDGSGSYVTDHMNYYVIGYDWYFGEGGDSAHDNPVQHTYTAPGKYVVSLKAVENAMDGSVSYVRGLPVYDTITVTGTAGVNPRPTLNRRVERQTGRMQSTGLDGRVVPVNTGSEIKGLVVRRSADGRLIRREITVR